ncbi:POZ domain-containing protein [Pseudovirgaria hyperparasitica]|uniref:Elongin-C n=1 Tax=Pseudovirgaria hyperparasitica TaxID=470096 RepID=A0A6A6WHB1_9PEZI|nr:POZ domain-containing protein [Pseudovirgaria hyperparasitica]KAF2761609.1 POZ domain-containing protein [Pseudovirgaria hyperparasitica]
MSEEKQTEYVTLVSCDGFEFKIKRSAAILAGAIKNMLDPNSRFQEGLTGRCEFENINGLVLDKVCEYLYYNEKHKDAKDMPDLDIPPELCLELLMAADYLNEREREKETNSMRRRYDKGRDFLATFWRFR